MISIFLKIIFIYIAFIFFYVTNSYVQGKNWRMSILDIFRKIAFFTWYIIFIGVSTLFLWISYDKPSGYFLFFLKGLLMFIILCNLKNIFVLIFKDKDDELERKLSRTVKFLSKVYYEITRFYFKSIPVVLVFSFILRRYSFLKSLIYGALFLGTGFLIMLLIDFALDFISEKFRKLLNKYIETLHDYLLQKNFSKKMVRTIPYLSFIVWASLTLLV